MLTFAAALILNAAALYGVALAVSTAQTDSVWSVWFGTACVGAGTFAIFLARFA